MTSEQTTHTSEPTRWYIINYQTPELCWPTYFFIRIIRTLVTIHTWHSMHTGTYKGTIQIYNACFIAQASGLLLQLLNKAWQSTIDKFVQVLPTVQFLKSSHNKQIQKLSKTSASTRYGSHILKTHRLTSSPVKYAKYCLLFGKGHFWIFKSLNRDVSWWQICHEKSLPPLNPDLPPLPYQIEQGWKGVTCHSMHLA